MSPKRKQERGRWKERERGKMLGDLSSLPSARHTPSVAPPTMHDGRGAWANARAERSVV